MALLPLFDMDTIMEPWNEPFRTAGFNIVPRSMRRSIRRMDRELGKLLSSVKEDDKSFQVMSIALLLKITPVKLTFCTGDGGRIAFRAKRDFREDHGQGYHRPWYIIHTIISFASVLPQFQFSQSSQA